MSQFISLLQAIEMTTRYRQEKENILSPAVHGRQLLPLSETFDREIFDALLDKPGCSSLRIYYGMDSSLKVHALVVAVNKKNEDMLNAAILTTEAIPLSGGDVGEDARRCPDDCPPASVLNQ